jgi:hypothetical protein
LTGFTGFFRINRIHYSAEPERILLILKNPVNPVYSLLLESE